MKNEKRLQKEIENLNCIMNLEKIDDLVHDIDDDGQNLTAWEVKFIADLIDAPPDEYSKKQIEIIKRIYDKRV